MGSYYIQAEMKAGVPFEIEFPITEEGALYPLDSLFAKIQLRAETEQGKVQDEWTEADAELIKTTGLVRLILPASITKTYKFKKGYLDLLLFTNDESDGERSDVVEITLYRGVTSL